MKRGLISLLLCSDRFGRELVVYEETDSTNMRVKEAARSGAGEGLVVLAEQQTAGRGRRGRSWLSLPGENIYMTVLLRPDFLPDRAPMLTLLMACAVTRAVRRVCHVEVGIKWPNDLVFGGRKICGILTEMSVVQGAVDYVLIGVGINCNQREFPEELAEKATSIWLETGQAVPRETLVCRVLEEFEQLYIQFCKEQSLAFIKDEYEAALVNRGETVCVLEPGHEWKGTALGISKTGALIIKTDGGDLREVDSGEVSVRGVYGYI